MKNDRPEAAWFKSSYSAGRTECVEVAWLGEGKIGVRDSKNPTEPALTFEPAQWDCFTTHLQNGNFTQPV